MKIIAVIPARYASTRFHAKLMEDLGGKTVILRTYEAAQKSHLFDDVFVVTDSDLIYNEIVSNGGKSIMSIKEHESGSDRIAEAVENMDVDIVVNVQGDEPLIPPAIIDQVAANLAAHPEAAIATLAEPIEDVTALFNPNVVKVSSDINGLALTFSRAPLPWARDALAQDRNVLPAGVPYRRHIGIYAYRAGFLHDFVAWGPCQLEDTECLEQLRALWHGERIHVADALQSPPAGVDTAEDLERVRRLLGA